MDCPLCLSVSGVKDTRRMPVDGLPEVEVLVRIRQCGECGHRWRTSEISLDGLPNKQRKIAIKMHHAIVDTLK